MQYRPTTKACDAGHKLARQEVYDLTDTGGLAYPNGAGGFTSVDAATVAGFLADGWLEACAPALSGESIADPAPWLPAEDISPVDEA